jgi:hypothetical protein
MLFNWPGGAEAERRGKYEHHAVGDTVIKVKRPRLSA